MGRKERTQEDPNDTGRPVLSETRIQDAQTYLRGKYEVRADDGGWAILRTLSPLF
nr:MAG TPA: hypothetical protein [Caudoviricetes sp.]